jgi:hypothetical protein
MVERTEPERRAGMSGARSGAERRFLDPVETPGYFPLALPPFRIEAL